MNGAEHRGAAWGCGRSRKRRAFTLIEVLLAVALLSVVAAVTFLTFDTVVRAWRRGTELSEDLQHGDYVAEQLVMALRSAYYPSAANVAPAYGFWMEDGGAEDLAEDRISWVKMGHTLVGRDCPFAETPHRVEFWLDRNEDGETVAAVKAWRLHGQPEDFDPEDVAPTYMSNRVVGFNCRTAYREVDDEIEWLDAW